MPRLRSPAVNVHAHLTRPEIVDNRLTSYVRINERYTNIVRKRYLINLASIKTLLDLEASGSFWKLCRGAARNFPHNNLRGTSITCCRKIKRRRMELTSIAIILFSLLYISVERGQRSIYGFVLWEGLALMGSLDKIHDRRYEINENYLPYIQL